MSRTWASSSSPGSNNPSQTKPPSAPGRRLVHVTAPSSRLRPSSSAPIDDHLRDLPVGSRDIYPLHSMAESAGQTKPAGPAGANRKPEATGHAPLAEDPLRHGRWTTLLRVCPAGDPPQSRRRWPPRHNRSRAHHAAASFTGHGCNGVGGIPDATGADVARAGRALIAGEVSARLRPDNRCFLDFDTWRADACPPLADAVARDLGRDLYVTLEDAEYDALDAGAELDSPCTGGRATTGSRPILRRPGWRGPCCRPV